MGNRRNHERWWEINPFLSKTSNISFLVLERVSLWRRFDNIWLDIWKQKFRNPRLIFVSVDESCLISGKFVAGWPPPVGNCRGNPVCKSFSSILPLPCHCPTRLLCSRAKAAEIVPGIFKNPQIFTAEKRFQRLQIRRASCILRERR